MTWKEFRDQDQRRLCRLCRVTIEKHRQYLVCLVLEWEESNGKWYALEPFEGRKEVGYLNEIFEPGESNSKIVDIGLITFYSPYRKKA